MCGRLTQQLSWTELHRLADLIGQPRKSRAALQHITHYGDRGHTTTLARASSRQRPTSNARRRDDHTLLLWHCDP